MGASVLHVFVVLAIWILLVSAGVAERIVHGRARARMPIRIHVNGTRGKTSVVRLIAAGLRAAGKRTCAKTSGSFAAVIDERGREYPIYRPSQPNIIEQVRIMHRLSRLEPEVAIFECMALQPHYQSLTELQMIRSTIGVITNARADHLDVMGPESRDVARALAGMTPVGADLFTAERQHVEILRRAAEDRGTALHEVTPEHVDRIDDSVLERFRYSEHADNVELALQVCEHLGVERDTALEGMVALEPEAGATRVFHADFFGRDIVFVHAFAANDPESTEMIWERMVERHGEGREKIAVINCRIDRPDRSRQLAHAIGSWTQADAYVVIGVGTLLFVRRAVAAGIPAHAVTMLEDVSTEETAEILLDLCGERTLIVGMANIHGGGLELARFFHNRSSHAEAV